MRPGICVCGGEISKPICKWEKTEGDNRMVWKKYASNIGEVKLRNFKFLQKPMIVFAQNSFGNDGLQHL